MEMNHFYDQDRDSILHPGTAESFDHNLDGESQSNLKMSSAQNSH